MSAIPHGVGAAPGGQKGKLMCIKVRLLDDTVAVFHLGVGLLLGVFLFTFLLVYITLSYCIFLTNGGIN